MKNILFIILLSGCTSIPPEMQNYVSEFQETFGGKRVVAEFGELPPTLNGHCYLIAAAPNRIVISLEKWNAMSDKCRRNLVFHEMAHCALELGHTPTGIMRPELDCEADPTSLYAQKNTRD